MGWNPFKKWFGIGSNKEKQAQQIAAAETEKARRIAEAAAVPTQDSNEARNMADRRIRRLSSMRGLAGTAVSNRATNTQMGQ